VTPCRTADPNQPYGRIRTILLSIGAVWHYSDDASGYRRLLEKEVEIPVLRCLMDFSTRRQVSMVGIGIWVSIRQVKSKIC
jgi:hypothetical protein